MLSLFKTKAMRKALLYVGISSLLISLMYFLGSSYQSLTKPDNYQIVQPSAVKIDSITVLNSTKGGLRRIPISEYVKIKEQKK